MLLSGAPACAPASARVAPSDMANRPYGCQSPSLTCLVAAPLQNPTMYRRAVLCIFLRGLLSRLWQRSSRSLLSASAQGFWYTCLSTRTYIVSHRWMLSLARSTCKKGKHSIVSNTLAHRVENPGHCSRLAYCGDDNAKGRAIFWNPQTTYLERQALKQLKHLQDI